MTDTREKIIEDLEVELSEFKDAITLLKIEFTNKLALLKLYYLKNICVFDE